MAKRKRKTSSNRKSDNKKPKLIAEPVSTTKITALNIDCFEHIFKYLSAKDMLSVADSSKIFKTALDLAFPFKYKRHHILLKNILLADKSAGEIVDFGEELIVTDFRQSLKIMRCFGHLFSCLSIYFSKDDLRNTEFDHYLREYCANSTQTLNINGATKSTFQHIEKPFSKVESLMFRSSVLNENLTDFNKWFPQMRTLIFRHDNKVTNVHCVERHFPNLRSFEIGIDIKNIFLDSLILVKFFHFNPNIRHLVILGNFLRAKFLHSASMNLQNLESLKITLNRPNSMMFPLVDNTKVILKNLKKFDYVLDNENGNVDIPFSFESLEHFAVRGCFYTDRVNDDVIEFVNAHPTLKSIDIRSSEKTTISSAGKMKLAKALSSVNKISLDGCYKLKLTEYDVENFKDTCKMLKEFQFKQKGVTKIMTKDGNKWKTKVGCEDEEEYSSDSDEDEDDDDDDDDEDDDDSDLRANYDDTEESDSDYVPSDN